MNTSKPKLPSSRSTAKPVPKAKKELMPKTSKQPKSVKSLMPKKTLGPLPKNPTLNDYLARGIKPPVKKGLKVPSDADVRIKGYNKK